VRILVRGAVASMLAIATAACVTDPAELVVVELMAPEPIVTEGDFVFMDVRVTNEGLEEVWVIAGTCPGQFRVSDTKGRVYPIPWSCASYPHARAVPAGESVTVQYMWPVHVSAGFCRLRAWVTPVVGGLAGAPVYTETELVRVVAAPLP
jgi:hypothetical protein